MSDNCEMNDSCQCYDCCVERNEYAEPCDDCGELVHLRQALTESQSLAEKYRKQRNELDRENKRLRRELRERGGS
jgi:hypothetical protein